MPGENANGPNADQIAYWNGPNGQRWVRNQEAMDVILAPLGERAMDALGVAAGDRVLDVGCGCGATAIELARRVGPSGAVTGVDISAPMLARAQERAARESSLNLSFLRADVSRHRFEEPVDRAFSRFGVMFFTDPATAFASIRRALRPGGRLGFVCWADKARNLWRAVPIEAASPHIELPQPIGPNEPGPFAFEDRGRVEAILDSAGFEEIRIDRHEGTFSFGDALDVAVDRALRVGPLGVALEKATDAQRAAIEADMAIALERHATPDGIALGYASWIVTARA